MNKRIQKLQKQVDALEDQVSELYEQEFLKQYYRTKEHIKFD